MIALCGLCFVVALTLCIIFIDCNSTAHTTTKDENDLINKLNRIALDRANRKDTK